MNISVDGVIIYTVNDTQLKVFADYMPSAIVNDDINRRLGWIIDELYKASFGQLKTTWDPILATRVQSIPTDPDAYAQLIFSQPDYKDRATRDAVDQQPGA